MRVAGTLAALVGAILLAVGLFMGFGSLFTWNGRHVVEILPLTPGAPLHHVLSPEPGRRYTVSVDVVFDRATADEPYEGGPVTIEAKLPLVGRVTDAHGAPVGETKGWIDPEEPPTVLFGTHPSPRQADRVELVAERIVGAFHAATRDPFQIDVDLGPDRVQKARIVETRLVIYDDVTPPSIRRSFWLAGIGGVAFLGGVAVLIASFFVRTSRRGGKRKR